MLTKQLHQKGEGSSFPWKHQRLSWQTDIQAVTDRCNSAACQRSLNHIQCPFLTQSSVLPFPLTQSHTPTCFPCHVVSRHVHSLSVSFTCAPLISLWSRMQAECAASPRLKITSSVCAGKEGRCVCVWQGVYRLKGRRLNQHSCSYSTE